MRCNRNLGLTRFVRAAAVVVFLLYRYNKYTQIAARALRASLKEEERVVAEKRGLTILRYQRWEKGQGGPQVRAPPSPAVLAAASLTVPFPAYPLFLLLRLGVVFAGWYRTFARCGSLGQSAARRRTSSPRRRKARRRRRFRRNVCFSGRNLELPPSWWARVVLATTPFVSASQASLGVGCGRIFWGRRITSRVHFFLSCLTCAGSTTRPGVCRRALRVEWTLRLPWSGRFGSQTQKATAVVGGPGVIGTRVEDRLRCYAARLLSVTAVPRGVHEGGVSPEVPSVCEAMPSLFVKRLRRRRSLSSIIPQWRGSGSQ